MHHLQLLPSQWTLVQLMTSIQASIADMALGDLSDPILADTIEHSNHFNSRFL